MATIQQSEMLLDEAHSILEKSVSEGQCWRREKGFIQRSMERELEAFADNSTSRLQGDGGYRHDRNNERKAGQ